MTKLIKRGLVYETLIFFYATLITWLVFGNPLKAMGLSLVITVTKYPIYWLFHWRCK